jgi:hypothetical protein
MRIALDDPDIADRWLEDEGIFASAELHRRDSDYVTRPATDD